MKRKKKRRKKKSAAKRFRRFAGIFLLIALIVGGWIYWRMTAYSPGVEPDREQYPVRGIDVSAHNGKVDFGKVKADGYEFVVIKATEGTSFKDRRFRDNFRNAREAGMKVGVYHFFRFDTDGALQASNFINSLNNRQLDFPAIIDVEEWGNPDGHTAAQIIGRLRKMIERMEYYGYPVMIYTNKSSYDRYIRGNFDNYPLWICTFSEPDPDLEWTIWQYSHRGRVDGIEGNVDLNTIKSELFR